MRIRVAGVIPMSGGFAFMHRKDVKNHPLGDYYTFPGGGLEETDQSKELGCIREVYEEFGLHVTVEKLLYTHRREDLKALDKKNADTEEYFYLCKVQSGEFGKGTGPEFSNNPEYSDRGKYIPEIIPKDEIEDLLLVPPEIKAKLVNDIKNGIFNEML